MAEENERRGTEDPPRYAVVTDKGMIKMVAVAPGINGALYSHKGRIKVGDDHAALGWVLLEQLYADEGRQDLWATYQSYMNARAEKLEVDGPFPEEMLPEEVRRRRAGHRPGRRKWTPPVVGAPVENQEPARRSRPKPQPAAES